MMTIVAHPGEVDMALVRSSQSLEKVKDAYLSIGKGKMQLRSYHLRPYHMQIIDVLADETGKGKAEVLRDLIDEWVEFQLRASQEGGQ